MLIFNTMKITEKACFYFVKSAKCLEYVTNNHFVSLKCVTIFMSLFLITNYRTVKLTNGLYLFRYKELNKYGKSYCFTITNKEIDSVMAAMLRPKKSYCKFSVLYLKIRIFLISFCCHPTKSYMNHRTMTI